MGVRPENCILCDTKGVVYRGRTEGMNQWKSAHAVDTKARTLAEAVVGCDVFLGLSAKGALHPGHGQAAWRKAPIIFAMANPDPEITPEDVKAVRADAIVATGRSDYPNQVNNVLGFPYIFRGALDVRATHHQRSDEDRRRRSPGRPGARGRARRSRRRLSRRAAGLWSRLHHSGAVRSAPDQPSVSRAVAEAAMKTGVARREIKDLDRYPYQLSARLDPSAGLFQMITSGGARQAQAGGVRGRRGGSGDPRRRRLPEFRPGQGACWWAAPMWSKPGFAPCRPRRTAAGNPRAASAQEASPYIDALYKRIQRRGALHRDAVRMVTNDRNIYAASMLAAGDADAMVTGVTRNYAAALNDVRTVLDASARRSGPSACR